MAPLEGDVLLLVSIHSLNAYTLCRRILEDNGIRICESAALRRSITSNQVKWHGDPDLIGLGPKCKVASEVLERFEFCSCD